MQTKKLNLIFDALLHDVSQILKDSGLCKPETLLYEILTNNKEEDISKVINASNYISNGLVDDAIVQNVVSPLKSIFNVLNGNNGNYYLKCSELSIDASINMPVMEKPDISEADITHICQNIISDMSNSSISFDGVNTLLDSLEKNVSSVSCGYLSEAMNDISLFDHLKMTAAIATCIYDYLIENPDDSIKSEVELADTNAMLLYSMDFSGIQNFIYTIASKGALKTLRARSFYLEILMEVIIDSLLEKLNVTRANLIYSGGGHCYMLLPNTTMVKECLTESNKDVNEWLFANYGIALYIADGYVECSGNALNNKPSGSYSELFKSVSSEISNQKSCRYNSEHIRRINSRDYSLEKRECSVCKRLDTLNSSGECSLCSSIRNFSTNILHDDLFLVIDKDIRAGLKLPGHRRLVSMTNHEFESSSTKYIRMYSKNSDPLKVDNATKIWIGSYSSDRTFEEMANDAGSRGRINRIAIVRADIDNLGTAFVSGFNENNCVNIMRTATLSRQLSAFFKLYINRILTNPEFVIDGRRIEASRNATICYSGGDDLFIVGAWDDVIELSIDIRQKLKQYSQGTLSISAGIGVYDSSYPISRIAHETAELEDMSKGLVGKDGISIFEDGKYHLETKSDGGSYLISDATYKWDDFINDVLLDKYKCISDFFESSDERGKNFLYNLLELIRNQNEKINFARYVYLLSRMEPNQKASSEEKDRYKVFSKKMYEWIKDEKACRSLKTAINLYAYMNRNKEEN